MAPSAPVPVCGFHLELLSARTGQAVDLGAASILSLFPLGVEPSGALEPLQRGEQRAGVHLEDAARDLLHPAGDAEAVHGLQAEGLQYQHVECSLDHVSVLIVHGR